MKTSAVLFLILLSLPIFFAQQDPKPKEEDPDQPAITWVNDPASVKNLNIEKEHIISAFVFSQKKITKTEWKLEGASEEESKAFFEKVTLEVPEGEVQKTLKIDPQRPLLGEKDTSKTFTVVITVTNEAGKTATDKFTFTIRRPELKYTMTVEPNRGIGLRDSFNFKFNKTGPAKVSYSLSYQRGARLITISSGLDQERIPDISYKFPVLRETSKNIIVTLAYAPSRSKEQEAELGQAEIDDTSVQIELLKPQVFSLKEVDDLLKQEEAVPADKVDIAHLTALVHTISIQVFHHDYYHAGEHKIKCIFEGGDYCSGNGECTEVHFYWKKCQCRGTYSGPICGITKVEETSVVDFYGRIIKLLEKAKIDVTNIGHMTEIIKSIASHRHILNEHIFKGVFKLIDMFLEKVGDSVNDKEVVEDIFIALENINAAETKQFWSEYQDNNNTNPGNFHKIIKESRQKIFQLLDLIIRRRKTYDRWDHTMETGGISLFTTTPAKMTNISTADLVISSGLGNLTESVAVKIPTDLLKNVKEGKESLAITAYQAFHNSFEAVMVDNFVVVSPVLTLTLKLKSDASSAETSIPDSAMRDNQIMLAFPKPSDDQLLSKLKCGVYNDRAHTYEASDVCKAIYTGTGVVMCNCQTFGTFALVVPNPAPKLKVTDNKKEEEIKPTSPPLKFENMQFYLSGGFMLALWLCTFLVNRNEGESNPLFSEQVTVHPIYSIVNVYTATISRSVKVHLLFLTFASQLAFQAGLLTATTDSFREDMVKTALFGILFSIITNYVSGMLAKIISGGNKVTKRGQMIIIAEALIVAILVYANWRMGLFYTQPKLEVMTLIKSWGLGLAIDLLGLDILIVFLAKIPAIRSIVSLRGFYSKGLLEGAGYVIQTDNPLMK